MYIAVDIGGTKTLIASFDDSGELIASQKFVTNPDYEQFISELIENIHDLCDNTKITAVSVAVPGHIEDDNGIAEGFGNLAWEHKDIVGDLSPHFKAQIILDNDANLGALGEATMGAGKGKRKVLYVTISTGIGTGVAIDGKIDPVMKESEGGQILLEHDGQLMPWEKFSSGKAFYEHYHKQGKDVDDPLIWEEFASNLSRGMWNLIALIQPDIVIIGGSMGVHFHKYGTFLNDTVAKFNSSVVDHPPIVQALYPDEAVINGCYQAAKQHVEAT